MPSCFLINLLRVSVRPGQQSTALEIMDQMTQFQESALERLYRWSQSHCRNIEAPRGGGGGDPAGPASGAAGERTSRADPLARAMRHLRRRPVMFRYVLDEYCAARKATLVRAFIDALTVGGPSAENESDQFILETNKQKSCCYSLTQVEPQDPSSSMLTIRPAILGTCWLGSIR